uniref:Uncharacterized protein n=1 Tax=Arundo donax TaxID=35708 RepID=A0A0A9G540_ARUDO
MDSIRALPTDASK